VIFTTWLYGLFLAVVVAGVWTLPMRVRPWWLIAAGLIFYANYFPPHLPLIFGLTIFVYATARFAAVDSARRRRVRLAVGVTVSLCILGYYKYTGFTLDVLSALRIGNFPGVADFLPVRAPLAISFFVFEYVHYLIEIRRGNLAPGRPRDFLLFILFFPTLICGPIKRFNDFQPQVGARVRIDRKEINDGLERIFFGLGKKLLVADTVQRLIAPLWLTPLAQPIWLLWLMTYGYAIQILFDFSGYSDIAIGSAQLLGFHVPENFNYPYLQPNPARFWRSWHMSLTSWITDYVYIPLGGNRRGAARTYLNRLIAMALCGLWHGAAGHFVLWGVYHGVGLNVHRAYLSARRCLPLPPDFGILGRIAATVLTFHFVCIGWVLFVLDVATAQLVISRMLGLS
jgi:alginate O-acetyltransferase complex protein AlgI